MSATDMIEVAHTVNLPATAVFFDCKKDKKFKVNLQITSRAQNKILFWLSYFVLVSNV